MKRNKKILAGVAALAAVSLVGGGTYAYFTDTEVTPDLSLAAGTLDLGIQGTPTLTLANLAPGATGKFDFALDNFGTLPGDLSLQVVITESNDNACNEPEDRAEGGDGVTPHDACGAAGELVDAVVLTIKDDHSITPDWTGTIRQLRDETVAARHAWFMLDAPNGGSTRLLSIGYSIPTTVGNEIQSDSVKFHVNMQLDQQV